MLQMFRIACMVLLSGSMLNLQAGQAEQREGKSVRVKARVVKQEYCRGNAVAYSILLQLKIEIENTSRTPVRILWPLHAGGGKVASSIEDAEAGRFLYEQTETYVPQDRTHFKRVKVEPGQTVSREVGYYLIARQNAESSFPKSVSPGTYAMIVMLGPIEVPPTQMEGPDTLQRVTTEPFVVEVPADAKIVKCDGGTKFQ